MLKEFFLDEHFITAVISVIVAFFFGQTGILKIWFEKIFISREKREASIAEEKRKTEEHAIAAELKEAKRYEALEAEKEELKAQISELRDTINKLDKDLTETTIYVKTLLAFLESAIPEGTNPFIVQMATEIRKKQK